MDSAELAAAVAALETMPADAAGAPAAVLVARMRQLVRLRAMADSLLIEQLAAFDARAAARYDGQTSTQAWLRSRLRLGGQVGDLLRTARQLGGLTQIGKAFAAGEIQLEHAAAVATLAGEVGAGAVAEYEPILVDLARQAPPAKLRAACDHLRHLLEPDGDAEEAARQRRRRYLAAGRTVDGMVHLQGLLDAAGGDAVLTALRAAMPVPAEYEERSPAQRRADALVDVCAGWLAAGEAPTSGGVRPQVQVTVSLRALQPGTPTGASSAAPSGRRSGAAAGAGSAAPAGTAAEAAGSTPANLGQMLGDVPVLADLTSVTAGEARRMACDAGVIPAVLGAEGELLDVGRRSRVVPVGLRRALNLRDGGCRFAGCDRPSSWCDGHHLRHWADGGPTSLDNLILLCPYHHTLVHEGWRLGGDPQGTVRFERPDGTRLGLTSTPRSRPLTRGP
jgi:hypothetical protein